jgi:maltose alpha-D-glucosyltransferase/alpha-amylase
VRSREGRVEAQNLGLTAERVRTESLVPIARTAPDQSNSSVIFGRRLIMKFFRRLEPGPNPDVEIGRYLIGRTFARVPPLVGTLQYSHGSNRPAAFAMVQEFVNNEGNAWQVTIDELGRYFERRAGRPLPTNVREAAQAWLASGDSAVPQEVKDAISTYVSIAEVLGRRTGELHVALGNAAPQDEAFAPEVYTREDLARLAESMQKHARGEFDLLQHALDRLDERKRALAQAVLDRREDLLRRFDDLTSVRDRVTRIRCHGDYHLGQVLVSEGDVIILDFEGEPARPLAERRAKSSPLRDVAGMLRSFGYAALTALGAATVTRPEDSERLAPWAEFWEVWVSAVFLRAYLTAVGNASFVLSNRDDLDLLLQTFVLDKALYELAYELNNRPDWVHIPLAGLLNLHSPLHA